MNHDPPRGAHLSNDLIERFTLGEVDEATAILAAEHMDACPYCSARTVQHEPLATAFAHAMDPELPVELGGLEGLVAAVLVQASRPEAPAIEDSAAPELLVGGALLAAASVLLAFGDWMSLASQTVVLFGALRAASQAASSGMPSTMLLFPVTALCGLLCVFVVATSADLRMPGRAR